MGSCHAIPFPTTNNKVPKAMLRWRTMRRKRRHAVLIFLLTLSAIALVLTSWHSPAVGYPPQRHTTAIQPRNNDNPLLLQHARFWKRLHQLMVINHPNTKKKPDLVVPRNPSIAFDPEYARPRPDVLWMDQADISRMKSAHTNFVADIQSLSDDLVFKQGTKGIVTTASESMLGILTVSLRMLRKTRCTLPVEIILKKPSPYTVAFCSKVFPAVDAKCVYLSEIFATAETDVSLHSYQYKIFSILFSSFESVLLLDSDAWPLTDPTPLFSSLPFTDSGMILFPDFWYGSESPYFFEIAKIHSPPPLNDRPATESGEMLYNKSKHNLSIMLATYYNYYGPDHYYLLQSQGGPGQGDKDTFPWAATALSEQFYFVNHPVRSLGRHDSSGEYIGTGMIHFDPIQDYLHTTHHTTPSNPKSHSATISDPHLIAHPPTKPALPAPRPLFVHANFPKFDPMTIFSSDIGPLHLKSPTRDSNGNAVRCWFNTKEEAVEFFGFDAERRIWQAMEDAACGDLLGLWVAGGKPDRSALEMVRRRDEGVCERVRAHVGEVFGRETEEGL